MTLTRKLAWSSAVLVAVLAVMVAATFLYEVTHGTTYTYDPPWWSGAAAALFKS